VTRFRYPDGWNTRRVLGERPSREGTWLCDSRVPPLDAPVSRKRSYYYWLQIHWATPPWLSVEDMERIRGIYEGANPAHQQVDHIVPLKNPLVCGLNVPWNLKRLTIKANQSKSNNWWPDCPDHLCPVKNLPVDMFGFDTKPYQIGLRL